MLPLDHPDRIQIAFDDHRLVANAGLIPVPTVGGAVARLHARSGHKADGKCRGDARILALGPRKGPEMAPKGSVPRNRAIEAQCRLS